MRAAGDASVRMCGCAIVRLCDGAPVRAAGGASVSHVRLRERATARACEFDVREALLSAKDDDAEIVRFRWFSGLFSRHPLGRFVA